MSGQIIGSTPSLQVGLSPSLDPWLSQGLGSYVRDWLLTQYPLAVQDIFGFHALQLGASSIHTLANSRIAHRWCAVDDVIDSRASFYANASALPFFEATLDLVTLPLTLDMHSDPETVMDEVARVLVPEGRAVIAGVNPKSAIGLLHNVGFKALAGLPAGCTPFGLPHLQVALQDLGLVIESVRYANYGLLGASLLDAWGAKLCPSLGGLYIAVVRKRVMGVRPKRRIAWRMPKLSDIPLNPFPSPRPRGLRRDK